jgi:hypothetical protein
VRQVRARAEARAAADLAVDCAYLHRAAGLAIGARVVVGAQRRDHDRVMPADPGERGELRRVDAIGVEVDALARAVTTRRLSSISRTLAVSSRERVLGPVPAPR